MHVHTDHESLRYLKTCPRPLTPRQARWSQFLEEYNLTLWYVRGLENPAADACSRRTSRQLMDIENATRTRAFAIPLVEDWPSPEGEPVDEFLHVLEDWFSHDEVWPQPYNHLYVSLRSGRSVGKDLDADELAEPALQFDTSVVEPEDLEPLPSSATTAEPEDLGLEPASSDEIMAENSHQPDMHLDEAGNEPDTSTDTDDLPDVSIDRPLRVTFGNELQYPPTMTDWNPTHTIAQHAGWLAQSPATQQLTTVLKQTEVLEAVRRGLVPTAVYTLLRTHAEDPQATAAHMQRTAVAKTAEQLTYRTHKYLQHAATLPPTDQAHLLKLLFYQP